jgi:hypothetical protein
VVTGARLARFAGVVRRDGHDRSIECSYRYSFVKFDALETVPIGAAVLVTVIFPVVAAAGTTDLSWVDETNVVLVAVAPLNLATEEVLKPTPLIVTVVPAAALVGLKPVTERVAMKLAALVAVPEGVVTEILPLVAPLGTVAVICVSLTT